MATKTVVCPECGAAAAPGRYACAECGSLLAAVAALPRPWDPEPVPAPPPAEALLPGTEPVLPAAKPAEPVGSGASGESGELDPPAATVDGWTPHPGANTAPAWVDPDDAPLGSIADPEPHPEPDLAPSAVVRAVDDLPTDAVAHLVTATAEAAVATAEPIAAEPAPASATPTAGVLWPVSTPAYLKPRRLEPAWPPPGDTGPQPQPAGRMPAGAYLPPSAFLDALDPATGAAAVPSAASGTTGSAARVTTTSARHRFDLSNLVGRPDLSADTPRAVIAVGAAIAAIGFLLPWADVLAGAGLLGGYFTQWGLAGPGGWIVVALLVGLVGVALAGAPTARWPVARAALAVAAVLVGLLWPYLFGVLGRSIGVWVVLAGAAVLFVGSILDRGERHDPDGPAVP